MFVAVGAGAFGAHALRDHFTEFPRLESTYETAVRYHVIHALAVLFTAWAAGRWPGSFVNSAGYLFLAGIVLFSGSLYILSLTDKGWVGAITPLGGLAFLAGWLMLGVAALKG